jgi:hypothetical protein
MTMLHVILSEAKNPDWLETTARPFTIVQGDSHNVIF